MKRILKLYANCVLVKGARRQVICDLQKNVFYFVPIELYEILTLYKDKDIIEIESIYNRDIVNDFIAYLTNNELAFLCSEPESFPDIEVKWEFPGYISNAIIELDLNSTYDIKNVFSELEKLGCKYLEIRFYSIVSINRIVDIIRLTNESKFRNISLLIKYDPTIELPEIEKMLNEYQRVGQIIIYSVPLTYNLSYSDSRIMLCNDVIENNKCCGQVSMSYFTANVEMYMESKLFNSCLNRKVSITVDGDIKNCPSTNGIFGNVKDINLESVITTMAGFKKLWLINKDQIQVCKDCEFRYICTDCRAFVDEPHNNYSRPLKCGYDPYIGVWEEWSTNPLKQNARKYYGV